MTEPKRLTPEEIALYEADPLAPRHQRRFIATIRALEEKLEAADGVAMRAMEERDHMIERWNDANAAFRTLERYGFRRCDIPACNCGSYHSPDGLLMPEGAAKLRAENTALAKEVRAWRWYRDDVAAGDHPLARPEVLLNEARRIRATNEAAGVPKEEA